MKLLGIHLAVEVSLTYNFFMQPNLTLNWPALVAAIVAAYVFGGVWYGPFFGKMWARAIGMNLDQKPDRKVMIRAMIMQLVGVFFTTFVLMHSVQVWRPSVWGAGTDDASWTYGFFGGFFTWIGFYIPLQINKVGWEGRPWRVFFINASHDFINLQLISQIIAHWR